MPHRKYWIWIQNALGYGSRRTSAILSRYETAEAFYCAGQDEWKESNLFSVSELKHLTSTPLSTAESIIEECRRCGYGILTPDDPEYPRCLRVLTDLPAALYVWGHLPAMDEEVGIAMVGTRKASLSGESLAWLLGYRLAEAGAVVVSGAAVGIDQKSLLGALKAKGTTVAVLGCGLSYRYLMEYYPLREQIAQTGAVISEYPPSFPASRYTFPSRNRLLSGLSKATVVVEAPITSGALITADHAAQQGKEVFTLPGGVRDKGYSGNIRLLQEGAGAVYTPMDILGEYAAEYPHKLDVSKASIPLGEDPMYPEFESRHTIGAVEPARKRIHRIEKEVRPEKEPPVLKKPSLPDGISAGARKIYNTFTKNEMPLDILISENDGDAASTLRYLTELELFGVVESVPGNRYRRME